jgi:hypothetical protein
MPWLFVSYITVQILFAIVHIVVDASFRYSNVTLVLDCKKNTDYVQINLLQFFIVNGIYVMNDLF